MLGRQHAMSGLSVGLHVAPWLIEQGTPPLVHVAQTAVIAAVCAGAALVPDIDHKSAHAARYLWWLSGAVCRVLRGVSVWAYRATRTPDDPKVDGAHRSLTHTALFSATLGAGVSVVCNVWPVWGALVVLALLVALAEEAVPGDWLLPSVGVAVLVWLSSVALSGADPAATLGGVGPLLGVCVAGGCVVHVLGDAATESGVPIVWPLKIAGQRWYRVGPPRWMRFPAGGACELLIVWPVLCAAAVAGVPGAGMVGALVWGSLTPVVGWLLVGVGVVGLGVRAAWKWDEYSRPRRRPAWA